MERIASFLETVEGWIWAPPLVALLFGAGLYLTVGTGFYTIRKLPYALGLMWKGRKVESGDESEGEIAPTAALFTALAATVGTGNIAGVATAIVVGGPGAVFWMWMTAVFGMATKYAEAVLAVRFRETDARGEHVGGPMYYIKNGMGGRWAWLAWAFAIFAAIAAFGIGNMVQANEVAGQFRDNFGIGRVWTGGVLAVIVFAVIIGGVRSIARAASVLVPFMAVAYVLAALVVVTMNASAVPAAFGEIFALAFTPAAAGGGFLGGMVMLAIQSGASRGVFSNEAGLGSAAIAHASAKTHDPVRQGTIAMLGTFIDTILICTLTALVILIATGDFRYNPARAALDRCEAAGALPMFPGEEGGHWNNWAPPADAPTRADIAAAVAIGSANGAQAREDIIAEHGSDVAGALRACASSGVEVPADAVAAASSGELAAVPRVWQGHYSSNSVYTSRAFGAALPGGQYVVTFGLVVFAFTTLLGWSLYGERAVEFIFGVWAVMPYRVLWCAVVFLGATIDKNRAVWAFAGIFNGLMAAPNLIALLGLSGVVFALTRQAQRKNNGPPSAPGE